MRFLLIVFCFIVIRIAAQRTVFNSAYKGNLSIEAGLSTSRFAKSDLTLSGNEFLLTFQDAKFNPINSSNSSPFSDFFKKQYHLGLGYTVKRGVQLGLTMDNFQYELAPQVYNINGQITPGFDQIGGLSGTYQSAAIPSDSVAFAFTAESTKQIALNLNLIQNLFRTKNRMFVVNGLYGLGLGLSHATISANFGSAYQSSIPSMSGFGLRAHAGLRIEFFRHFYLLTDVAGAGLFQKNMRLDVSDQSQRATQNVWAGQVNLSIGTVFYLGKKSNCDCPHF